jgi:hypothetical protein
MATRSSNTLHVCCNDPQIMRERERENCTEQACSKPCGQRHVRPKNIKAVSINFHCVGKVKGERLPERGRRGCSIFSRVWRIS